MQFFSRFLSTKENRAALTLTIAFVISRIIFRLAGVVFYGEFLKRLWQAIDVELLKTALLESLYYSHAQPPLFNVLSGIILKIFPVHYSLVFHVLFLILGWLNCLLVYFSLLKFKLPTAGSFVIALCFMLLPSVVLYENLYSYTYINVFLLTLSIYLLLSFCEKQNTSAWVLFCVTLCALLLLRSFYHFTWLMVIISIVLLFRAKENRPIKRLLIASVLPLLVVLCWLIKNWFVFGAFTTSTWMGMSIARIMPTTTPVGLVGPFKPIHDYKTLTSSSNDYPEIKLLHQEYKMHSGFVNYYHIDYIKISDQFKHDVMEEIRCRPFYYLGRVGKAFVIYFSPSSHAPFIDGNYQHISRYSSVIDFNFSGYKKFKREYFPLIQALPVFVLHLLLLVGLIFCFYQGLFNKAERTVILVMIVMLLYAMVIGNLLEYGENNRFRFEQLSVFVLLLAKTVYAIRGKFFERKKSS